MQRLGCTRNLPCCLKSLHVRSGTCSFLPFSSLSVVCHDNYRPKLIEGLNAESSGALLMPYCVMFLSAVSAVLQRLSPPMTSHVHAAIDTITNNLASYLNPVFVAAEYAPIYSSRTFAR